MTFGGGLCVGLVERHGSFRSGALARPEKVLPRLGQARRNKRFLDVDLAGGFVAVADEFQAGMVLLKEFLDGQGFVKLRDGGLVRLLGGGYQQPFHAVRLEDPPLGIIAEERRDPVDPDFRGLLGKPFEAVDVLGRADRHVEPVVVAAVILHPLVHLEADATRVVVHYRAAVEHPVAVHHVDRVAAPVTQHPHAMGRLVGIEHPPAGRNRF